MQTEQLETKIATGKNFFSVPVRLILALLCLSPGLSAQSRTFHAEGAFWRVDGSFRSRLILKNVLETGTVQVLPTLNMEDGRQYTLPSVTLAATDVVTVDINEALASMPPELQGSASLFGSIGIRYSWDWEGVVIGQVEMIDAVHSLSYVSHFVEPPDSASESNVHRIAGLWWSPTEDSKIFITITNMLLTPARVNIDVTGIGSRELVLQPSETKIETFGSSRRNSRSIKAGGVEISFEGPDDGIAVGGGIEDLKRGFSAHIPLRDVTSQRHWKKKSGSKDVGYASPGMMVGKPDKMMGFPSALSFTPFVFLRNLSLKPISVSAILHYTDAGVAQQVALKEMILAPGSVCALNSEQISPKDGFNGSVTLSFNYRGNAWDLLILSGSVDASKSYVFQVDPTSTTRSFARIVCYWSTLDGADTMYSLWNYSATPEDVVLTLFSASASIHVPIHLEPKAFVMMNASEILMMNASSSPLGMQGSAKLTGPTRDSDPLSVVLSVSTFNASLGTCATRCTNCSGYNNVAASPSPAVMDIQNNQQISMTAHFSTGVTYNVNSNTSFASENANVTTISSQGLGFGSSVGNTAYNLAADLPVPSRVCQVDPYDCGDYVFTERIPAKVRGPYQVIIAATNSNAPNTCSIGGGWYRNVTLQIADQDGNPFSIQGAVEDTITIGRNDLGIGSTKTGSTTTTPQGQWPDNYFFCSQACPASSGETDTIQQWSLNGVGLLKTNMVIYKCNSILINGQ